MVSKTTDDGGNGSAAGAVAIDGSRILNESILKHMRISESEIESITDQLLREARRRAWEYVGHDCPPSARGMGVHLAEDGLATGYTGIAAAKMVRNQNPKSLMLCAPVSTRSSHNAGQPCFDGIHRLITQAWNSFAVASFYTEFHDVSDDEVHRTLR